MRTRKNSGALLDYYNEVLEKTILQYQNPVTGLLPATPDTSHSWVRDNVYSILSVWGLSMAYKKNADLDDERAKAYELEQSCVKLMRGLLMCMMLQKEKVETFKETLSPSDSLHAKYNTANCQVVVRDDEWGHLQVDATSLYLLIMAQMTASGLQIIFNLDEVAFIQNLVFYIESAYCTPDYGIWERGDKTNHGLPELNASSIGMAKAALEAMNELDLFGARGGPASVIHVLADEAHKCQAVLQSMLPRESNSKELDAALLSVISFPAFAVTDIDLIKTTRSAIVEKLQGRYGCKRFLRDGYRTAKEDANRLYYEPWELRVFDNIECEWPLFFCYMIIDACFQKDDDLLFQYREALEEILIKTDDGMYLVPELYSVPADKVDDEYKYPHTQDRVALGKCPYMWAQSLYILGKLLQEKFIAPGELDPLNRRLGSDVKPDVVVQVVILAQDDQIRDLIRAYDITVQTISEVGTVEVQPARVLSSIYTFLGKNKKLNLTGRKSKDVGILSTSKLYALQDRIFAFTPQFADTQRFYIASDIDLLIDTFKTEIAFLKSNWHMMGRPTVVIPVTPAVLDEGRIPGSMLSTMKKLKSGYINGTRVNLGKLENFLSTSCLTSLDFLNSHEEGYPDSLNPHIHKYLEKEFHKNATLTRRFSTLYGPSQVARRKSKLSRRSSVAGSIRKSRSFRVEEEAPSRVSIAPSLPPLLDTPPDRQRKLSQLGVTVSRGLLTGMTQAPFHSSPPESEGRTRTPSPSHMSDYAAVESADDDFMPFAPTRSESDAQFDNVDIDEVISTLRESDNLEEQGDILHYLTVTKSLEWSVYAEDGAPVKVKDLMKVLYEKACHERSWALVRHTAGMLGKRVEDLAKAVTDLLVRQKQVTVGMPPYNEKTITRPLPSSELRVMIHQVYGNDESTAMLTQELIVYLAMFIRTEPQLFSEMLRLRVGLIIQVMASELARIIKCPGTEASEYLLNLSPFEMKNLLHHIISGKEFGVHSARSGTLSVITNKSSRARKSHLGFSSILVKDALLEDAAEADRQGQWIRRRRLDGSLNRVPKNFYPKIWLLLERCHGITIAGKVVPQSLTQEMTAGELKFALQVETVLNSIPQPEYRQLVVEALMILYLVVEHDAVQFLGSIIQVESLVHKANEIFLQDQEKIEGDATLCCTPPTGGKESCGGTVGICIHFYDSAPSGCYGTMTYLIRAVASTLETLPADGEIDCNVS